MKFIVVIMLGVLTPFLVLADEKIKDDINAGLSRLVPDVEVSSIKKTPIEGIYQVMLGPDVIYMTGDGNFVIKGEILDIKQRRNLTEDVRETTRVKLIESIDKSEYIEFAPEDIQDVIYVFTDIDCGYCRKLHQDVPELNARGISVRYLAYPRAGIGSVAANEMQNVWCAEDKQTALTAAKNRQKVEEKSCDDPVAKQYELGQEMGVRGTPAIYLSNGKTVPGYMPPDKLMQYVRK